MNQRVRASITLTCLLMLPIGSLADPPHRHSVKHAATPAPNPEPLYSTVGDMPPDGMLHFFKPAGRFVTGEGARYPVFFDFEKSASTTLDVAPICLREKSGEAYRSLGIYVYTQVKDDASYQSSIYIEYSALSDVVNRFNDLLRIGRDWRQEGMTPAKDIDFVPADGLELKMWHDDQEATQHWSVTVTQKNKEATFTSSKLEDLSLLVSQLNDSYSFLKIWSL